MSFGTYGLDLLNQHEYTDQQFSSTNFDGVADHLSQFFLFGNFDPLDSLKDYTFIHNIKFPFLSAAGTSQIHTQYEPRKPVDINAARGMQIFINRRASPATDTRLTFEFRSNGSTTSVNTQITSSDSGVAAAGFLSNTWMQIACVFQSDFGDGKCKTRIYINGTEPTVNAEVRLASPGDNFNGSTGMMWSRTELDDGVSPVTHAGFVDGNYSEYWRFHHAMNASEVADFYNGGRGVNSSTQHRKDSSYLHFKFNSKREISGTITTVNLEADGRFIDDGRLQFVPFYSSGVAPGTDPSIPDDYSAGNI